MDARCLGHALGEFHAEFSNNGDAAANGNDDPDAAGDNDPDAAANALTAFFDTESQWFDMDHYIDGYVNSHASICDAFDSVSSTEVAPSFLDDTKHSFTVTLKGWITSKPPLIWVQSKPPLRKHNCFPFPADDHDKEFLGASPMVDEIIKFPT